MEKHFHNTKIDIKTLSMELIKYLQNEGLNIKLEGDEALYVITAEKRVKGRVKRLAIEIFRSQEDVIINFRNRHELKQSLYSSLIWQFFGGGFLLKEIYEDMEFYQQIEERFWRKVEELINTYSESSTHP